MKIVAVSMVKNEIDIIELFTRHVLKIVDELLIYDHNSFDGTYDILLQLSKKYNSRLKVLKYENVEYNQSWCITDLTKKAFKDLKADFVIPIDADEIISTDDNNFNHEIIRNQFDALDLNKVYKINLFRCIRSNYKKFLVSNNDLFYKSEVPEKNSKIVIGRMIYEDNCELVVAQGNHCLFKSNSEKVKYKEEIFKHIIYCHFSERSIRQFLKKYIFGTIHNIAMFCENTSNARHWLNIFDKIINNKINYNDIFNNSSICKNRTTNFNNLKIECNINIPEISIFKLLIEEDLLLAKQLYLNKSSY